MSSPIGWCATITDPDTTSPTADATGTLTASSFSSYYYGFVTLPPGEIIWSVSWTPVVPDEDPDNPTTPNFGPYGYTGTQFIYNVISPYAPGTALLTATVDGIDTQYVLRIVFSAHDGYEGDVAWDSYFNGPEEATPGIGWCDPITEHTNPVVGNSGSIEWNGPVVLAEKPDYYAGSVGDVPTPVWSTTWTPVNDADSAHPPLFTSPTSTTIRVTPDVNQYGYFYTGTVRINAGGFSDVLILVLSGPLGSDAYGIAAYSVETHTGAPPPSSSGALGLPYPWEATVTALERRIISDLPGLRQTRGIQRDRSETQQLKFVFYGPDEVKSFYDWVKIDLLEGGRWFTSDWPHPSGFAKLRRFSHVPTYPSMMGDNVWVVSCVCEIRGVSIYPLSPAEAYPRGDVPALLPPPPPIFDLGDLPNSPPPVPTPSPSPSPSPSPTPSPSPSPSPSPAPADYTVSSTDTITSGIAVISGRTTRFTITETSGGEYVVTVYTSAGDTPIGDISGGVSDYADIAIPSDVSSVYAKWNTDVSITGSLTFTVS